MEPTGSCALERCCHAQSRRGTCTGDNITGLALAALPCGRVSDVLSHHPSKAMVAEGEGSSHSGSSAGSGKLRKEADIRTGSPTILAELSDAQGHRLQPKHS